MPLKIYKLAREALCLIAWPNFWLKFSRIINSRARAISPLAVGRKERCGSKKFQQEPKLDAYRTNRTFRKHCSRHSGSYNTYNPPGFAPGQLPTPLRTPRDKSLGQVSIFIIRERFAWSFALHVVGRVIYAKKSR